MRCAITLTLLSAALLCALDSTGHAQAPTRPPRTVPNFVTVTDQIIRTPKPEDWLIHRGNYQSWGYSPLDQINKANVKNLQLVWSRAMEPGMLGVAAAGRINEIDAMAAGVAGGNPPVQFHGDAL